MTHTPARHLMHACAWHTRAPHSPAAPSQPAGLLSVQAIASVDEAWHVSVLEHYAASFCVLHRRLKGEERKPPIALQLLRSSRGTRSAGIRGIGAAHVHSE